MQESAAGTFPLPPKEWPSPVADRKPFAFFLLDRLEYRAQKGTDTFYWDAQAWYGGDYNKLWLKSEGQRTTGGQTEAADLQILYARRVAPFWHLQGGLRSEARPEPTKKYGVIALQGIAPYWFNVETTAFFAAARFPAGWRRSTTNCSRNGSFCSRASIRTSPRRTIRSAAWGAASTTWCSVCACATR